jgi:ribose transport system permease protein
MNDAWRFRLGQHRGTCLAAASFAFVFGLYIAYHPVGLNAAVATTAANKAVLLALVAMAQTLPVLTAGIDLSLGMIFVLANCLASSVVSGSSARVCGGVLLVLGAGALCGLINGCIVVFGRLQPIITTLATGSIYYGLALALRPVAGGDVNEALAGALTAQLPGGVPAMLGVLLAVVVAIWLPFRSTVTGRGALAIGSSEAAAYMSGLAIGRVKLVTYTLAGLLAAIAGLLLTLVTYSGEASAALAGNYTLNSIAAVVIGGTSLAGGSGSAIGSIFGAFVFCTLGDLLFVFDLPPLWQPLFLGVILLISVSLGSLRLLKRGSQLDLFP